MVDEPRDERLAELLEVEPLDEVTRRRLVARALEVSATAGVRPDEGRRWRLLAAVAAVVVVVVVGIGVLLAVPGGDGGDTDVALRNGRAKSEQRATEPGTSAGEDSAASAPAADPRAGPSEESGSLDQSTAADFEGRDLGDLTGRAGRDRAVAAAAAVTAPEGNREEFAAATAAIPCSSEIATRDVLVGRGSYEGRAAFVVLRPRDDGTRRVRLVITDPCEVRQLG